MSPDQATRGRVLNYELSKQTTDILSLYLLHFHRRLSNEPSDWLFPGKLGSHKDLRFGVKPTKDHICHRLFDDEILAVCSPNLAKGPPALETLTDLEKVALIHMEMEGITPATQHMYDWQSWFDTIGGSHTKSNRGLRFYDYNLATQAAIAGQGVLLGSWPVVKDAIEAGLLVSPFKERAKFDIGYDLVTTKDAAIYPEVDAFVEWILSEIKS